MIGMVMSLSIPCPGCGRATLSIDVVGDRLEVEHGEPVCAVFVQKTAEVEAIAAIERTSCGYSVNAREFVTVSPLLFEREGPPS